MAVKVVNREYTEAFTSGTTNWLLGNVGEWQKLLLDVEASVIFEASDSETIDISSTNQTIKLNNGKNWADYGFDIGQVCRVVGHYIDTDGNWDLDLTCIFTIVNIYNSIIETTPLIWQSVTVPLPIDPSISATWPANFVGDQTWPYERAVYSFLNVRVFANVEPEGARILYTHLTNADYQNHQLPSIIDSTTTEFIRPDVKSQGLNAIQPMQSVGLQSGMSVRGVTIKRKGLKPDTFNVYRYEIELQYMISSFFEDISNLENNEMPSFLVGDGSLTDNFKILFFPKWNNPNTLIQNAMENSERLGNTGWLNENYNALINNYQLTNLQYFDTNGNPVSALDYLAPTKVKAIINNVQNANNTTECGFGFIWIPKDDVDYKNLQTPFYRNNFVNTGDVNNGFSVNTFYPNTYVGGGINNASMDVKNIRFTDLGGGKISFEAIFIPNTNFFQFFDTRDDDRKYLLWLSIADSSLIRNYSDRVSLTLDLQAMIKTVPPAGEYGNLQNKFIEHPYNELAVGEVNYDGFVQDDILARMTFLVDPLIITVRQLRMGIEAFNPSTGQSFILEKHIVNMSQYPTDSNGVPQFSYNQSRGYKLGQTNSKNWVKINREPQLDNGANYGYIIYYGFKIRWEDWLQMQGVPGAFFDANALFNGFNNDWIGYLNALGWIINYFTEIDVIEGGVLKRYKNQFNFKFSNYDLNPKIATTHEFIRDTTNSLLNVGNDPDTGRPLGVVLSNEFTRLEITYEIIDSGTWSLPDYYATMTIEIDKGAGAPQMRQISSVVDSESDCPLIPLVGETHLKMEVDITGKFLKTSCLIDPNLLDDGLRYRITGRVGCYDGSGTDVGFRKYEQRYELRYE